MDQEWYRLVPKEAQDVLDKNEVKRQSVLFEVFKSEKNYVSDLELVREVCLGSYLKIDVPNSCILSGIHGWSSKRRPTSN